MYLYNIYIFNCILLYTIIQYFLEFYILKKSDSELLLHPYKCIL